MRQDFDDFMKALDAEVRHAGPEAVAEAAAFRAHHRLAREVFDLRKAHGMTQRALAARSGIQQAEISRIEAGNSNPTLATLAVLAHALDSEFSLARRRVSSRARKPGKNPMARTPTVRNASGGDVRPISGRRSRHVSAARTAGASAKPHAKV
jgi:transcriptional regulator with XRE-family HTH domain